MNYECPKCKRPLSPEDKAFSEYTNIGREQGKEMMREVIIEKIGKRISVIEKTIDIFFGYEKFKQDI